LVARDPVKGEAVVQEIAGLGGQSESCSVDLGDHDAVKALIEDVDGKYGALWDRCPHRGALLSYGWCEFEGTKFK